MFRCNMQNFEHNGRSQFRNDHTCRNNVAISAETVPYLCNTALAAFRYSYAFARTKVIPIGGKEQQDHAIYGCHGFPV